MNLFRLVIERKVFVGMVFIGITLMGYLSYRQLPVEILPDAEMPFLIVGVNGKSEMDPQYLEKQAVIPMESAIGRLEGVSEIETTVEQRSGQIRVTYNPDVRMKYAHLRLEEAMEEVKSSIPDDFTIQVMKMDTQALSTTFMGLQVRGGGGLERIRAIIDRKITRELEAVNGIASVTITGGREKSVDILLDEERCEAYAITPSTIQSLISRSTQSKTFLGKAWAGERCLYVNLVADYADVRDLEHIIVRSTGPVYLKDVATVSFGVKDETSISRVNGKDAVTIVLTRDSQANLIDLARATRSTVARLNSELAPEDIQIVIQTDTAKDMEENISLIKKLALAGGLLAIAVLWFFLHNLRMVTVIVLAIPISVFTAFNFFYAFGISINSLTLVGIALAVGMLLDNGVVVLENIMRLLAAHRDRDTAVIQGTSEVWRAIAAATATTITVFLPFVFSSNYDIRIVGKHVGISIISTLVVSLLVALFLTPMIIHSLLRRKTGTDSSSFTRVSYRNRLVQIYTLLLKSAMRFPARTVFGTAAAFFITLAVCVSLSMNVSREVELREFSIYLTPPRGATLDSTDRLTQNLEKKLEGIPEIQDIIARVFDEESTVTVVLKEDYGKIGKRSIIGIKEDIQKRIDNFPGADASLSEPTSSRRFGGGSMTQLPLGRIFGIGSPGERILVKGNDAQLLRIVAEDISAYLEDMDTIQSTRLNVQENRPEASLLFDNEMMNRESITPAAVAGELAAFGQGASTTAQFTQGTDEYDIVIRSSADADEEAKTAEELREVRVPAGSGSTVELGRFSRIVFGRGASTIHRLNQEKQIEVSYSFTSDVTDSKPALESARDDVDIIVAGISLPAGVAVEVLHDETDVSEFYFLLLAAFILIYMILASVFESFTSPLVMMFTIPLATIGALWALVLTGNSLLTASAMIGLLILLGVVVNNGIILIDFTRILRNRGYSRERALMTAGRARVRPILITSITTVAGMIPLAMGKAEYVSMIGAPFAIAAVGGLSLSALFTLVLLPTVYSGLETALAWLHSLDWRIKTLQMITLAVLALLIDSSVEGLLWKFAAWTVSLILVPGVLYFFMTSLRQARADYIRRDEPLLIHIRRIVKIYDADSRFVREWKKGARLEGFGGAVRRYGLDRLGWGIPLLGFLVYFVFFYLQSRIWIFIVSHAIYFFSLFLWRAVSEYCTHGDAVRQVFASAARRIGGILRWGLPVLGIVLFHVQGFRPAVLVFIALVWFPALAVHAVADRSRRGKIDIDRIRGRFSGARRSLYRFVRSVPVIGREKNPFQALDGVSLEISRGMFGLLGPNGAGKTTLMRVICGILDQSMGTLRVNDIDFREKREELQGLIGYLPQEFGTYENMTAREFLDYIAILKNITDRDDRARIVNHVLSSVHLGEGGDSKIASFSGGMKQRVGIAMTLLHLPRILVVDEPTAGLDPRERIRFRNLLVELSRDRIVIFSTHIIEDISSSCNQVAVLHRGSLAYLGDPLAMTGAVRGKVWQFLADDAAFAELRGRLRIVHHMRIDDRIRVRCLSETAPCPDAEPAEPTLEDAYLWLLGENGPAADSPGDAFLSAE